MKTDHTPRFTSKELAEQITNHIQELAEATDAASVSTEMTRYLETCARFHHYSWNNIWLILMSCPQATQVAGFRKWQSMNRTVRKGEHGIPILAPLLAREEQQDSEEVRLYIRGFKVVYVFDVSQTEGEPLPEAPDWKSPEKNEELAERLVAFAKEKGITVTEKVLVGETQGVSKGGTIELAPSAGTKTLIHEIAHELMHRHEDRPASGAIRELEAEAVAFVVGRHFDLEATGSPNYVALHGVTSEMIHQHLARIRASGMMIIDALEGRCIQIMA